MALGQLVQEDVAPEENSEKNIKIRPQEHNENTNSPSLPVPYFPDVASAGPPPCNPSSATPTPASATPTPAAATPTPAAASPTPHAATPATATPTPHAATPTCRGLFARGPGTAAARVGSPLTPTTSSSSKQRSIRGIVVFFWFLFRFV